MPGPYKLITIVILILFSFISLQSAALAEDLEVENFRCETTDGKIRTTEIGQVKEHKVCQIDDWVSVTISKQNLENWKSDNPEENTVNNLVLSLDGNLLFGQYGRLQSEESDNADPDIGTIVFHLKKNHQNEKNIASWEKILPRTKLYDSDIKSISVAVESTQKSFGAESIGIRAASIPRMITVLVLFLVVVGLLVYFAWSSDLLRDPGPNPDRGKKPFSLGKTQMALWFVSVFGAFLYLWLVTGQLDLLTPGVLGLIGISATTGVFATAITYTKETSSSAKRIKLYAEKESAEQDLKEVENQLSLAADPLTPEKRSELNIELAQKKEVIDTISKDIKAVTVKPSIKESANLFADIVTSEGEMSLSRFQMIAWTIVLIVIFIHSVYTTLNMPDYPPTLLGLMGLSSGTYIGFKFPTNSGK